jgi:hypothetical protein
MTPSRFVLNVRGVDGNFTRLFLRRSVNILVCHGFRPTLFRQDLGNRLRQGSLSMINVSNGTNVNMGLVTVECSSHAARGKAKQSIAVCNGASEGQTKEIGRLEITVNSWVVK